MEPASILVAVLIAGVVALLVWFEVNSRRNEARRKKDLQRICQAEQDRELVAQTETNSKKVA